MYEKSIKFYCKIKIAIMWEKISTTFQLKNEANLYKVLRKWTNH